MEHRRGRAGHSCDQLRPQLSAECCRQPSVSSFASLVILTLGLPDPQPHCSEGVVQPAAEVTPSWPLAGKRLLFLILHHLALHLVPSPRGFWPCSLCSACPDCVAL